MPQVGEFSPARRDDDDIRATINIGQYLNRSSCSFSFIYKPAGDVLIFPRRWVFHVVGFLALVINWAITRRASMRRACVAL